MPFFVCRKNSFTKYFWHKTIKDDKWACSWNGKHTLFEWAKNETQRFRPYPIFMTAVWTWKFVVHILLLLLLHQQQEYQFLWQPHATMCCFLIDFTSSRHERMQYFLRCPIFYGDVVSARLQSHFLLWNAKKAFSGIKDILSVAQVLKPNKTSFTNCIPNKSESAQTNWWRFSTAAKHTTSTCIQLIYWFNSSRLISWQISCSSFEPNENDVKCVCSSLFHPI